MQQSYPSPNASAADGGGPFYNTLGQPQPGQQQSGLSNPDELQLTAQLSRNLAPSMSGGPGGGMNEGDDLRSQGQPMVNHQYPQDPGQHAQSSHIQPGHGPMDHMGGQYASPDGSMAPRKRSKVSRACDECRRKKIRCDATGEPGDDQCSSCKRVGTQCMFSRVPMKRGPSKGYIKELADRVVALEGTIQQTGDIPGPQYLPRRESPPQQRRPSDDFSPPPSASAERKRTYSAVSNDYSTQYMPQRPMNQWSTPGETPQRAAPHLSPSFTPAPAPSSQMFKESPYSPNGLHPTPHWRVAPEQVRRPQFYESLGGTLGEVQGRLEHPPELEDAILDGYYSMIHHTYPLLPHNRSRLLTRLGSCSATLKGAFCESLSAAVKSFPSPNGPQFDQQSIRNAASLVAESQFENVTSRSLSTNLVYLQTMLLLAIQAGNYAPNSRGQASPSRSFWLGSALGFAHSMKLHLHRPPDKATENDPDSDEKLARRIWWTLVIMDRWHASSTASPLMIPDESVVVYPDDQALLGDTVYHLARLSIVLGHSAAIMLVPTDLPPLGVPPGPVYGTLLRGELERFRESLPPAFQEKNSAPPLIHLAYWHVRILVELTLAESDPSELLNEATNIIDILKTNVDYTSPITYNCTLLAALTLSELVEFDNVRAKAEASIKSLMDSMIAPSSWDAAARQFCGSPNRHAISAASLGVPPAIPDSKHALTASQGLQHLADLATATEGPRDAAGIARDNEKVVSSSSLTNVAAAAGGATAAVSKFQRYHHLRDVVRNGYLSVFVGGVGGDSGR